jgi:hypothetical protein
MTTLINEWCWNNWFFTHEKLILPTKWKNINSGLTKYLNIEEQHSKIFRRIHENVRPQNRERMQNKIIQQ